MTLPSVPTPNGEGFHPPPHPTPHQSLDRWAVRPYCPALAPALGSGLGDTAHPRFWPGDLGWLYSLSPLQWSPQPMPPFLVHTPASLALQSAIHFPAGTPSTFMKPSGWDIQGQGILRSRSGSQQLPIQQPLGLPARAGTGHLTHSYCPPVLHNWVLPEV